MMHRLSYIYTCVGTQALILRKHMLSGGYKTWQEEAGRGLGCATVVARLPGHRHRKECYRQLLGRPMPRGAHGRSG